MKPKFAKIEAMEPEGQNQKKEPKNRKFSKNKAKRKNPVAVVPAVTKKRKIEYFN